METDYMVKVKQALKKVLEDDGHFEDIGFREKKILCMRFGFSDYDKTHTLEEVGKEFGVTRERIRQIEAKALEKLRKEKLL